MGNYQVAFFLAIVVQGQETKRVCATLISFLIFFRQIPVFVDVLQEQGSILSHLVANRVNLNMLRSIWHCNLFVC